jgi:hypothetical protein
MISKKKNTQYIVVNPYILEIIVEKITIPTLEKIEKYCNEKYLLIENGLSRGQISLNRTVYDRYNNQYDITKLIHLLENDSISIEQYIRYSDKLENDMCDVV